MKLLKWATAVPLVVLGSTGLLLTIFGREIVYSGRAYGLQMLLFTVQLVICLRRE